MTKSQIWQQMLMIGCCQASLISALVDTIKRVKTFIPHPHIVSCLVMLAVYVQKEDRPCFACLHHRRYISSRATDCG